jgi:hypothetical protein
MVGPELEIAGVGLQNMTTMNQRIGVPKIRFDATPYTIDKVKSPGVV